MSDAIRSEYRKLRTTRTVRGLLAGLVGLVGLTTWVVIANAGVGTSVALTSLPLFIELMVIVPVFALVLGIRVYTDEARHGSIVPTLLAIPARRRVAGAKLVVAGASGASFALAATVVAIGISVAWLAAHGVAITVGAAALAFLVLKAIAIGSAWAAIGLGLGMLVSHQVAAIVGSLLWLLVGENLIELASSTVAKYLPAHAGTAVLGVSVGGAATLAPIAGAVVLAVWALLSVGAGTRALSRRDIA